ncbi:MAG: calcium/sodium antiporter [Lachnospiraceae bacterium]|nr:calcium/sodium antiporter [Lachnospiraceae bacterium]
MLIAVLLFIVGLACLIKGGDWFVDGSCGIAHRFGIPELLIGATVVSIGTTLPEVMVSATSAVKGHSDIAYGNAIGSIICNTALISAITITFKPSKVAKETLKKPIAFFFAAAALYLACAYIAGGFSRTVGISLLAIFVIYMVVLVKEALKAKKGESETIQDDKKEEPGKENPLWKDLVFIVIGAALIAVGADLLVDNGTIIAVALGVPESVVALTFVALGTSLPELVTAITSLIKGHGALSLGNIIGANLFNLVLVSGMAITLRPFKIPANSTIMGINSSLVVDSPVMLGVMLLLTLPALIKGKLYRAQGILLLCIYAAFVVFQFAFN